jgi:hypothetical protein
VGANQEHGECKCEPGIGLARSDPPRGREDVLSTFTARFNGLVWTFEATARPIDACVNRFTVLVENGAYLLSIMTSFEPDVAVLLNRTEPNRKRH